MICQNQLEEKGNVVIVGNIDITGENAQTIRKLYNNTVTGVELVFVTLTKQTIDPLLTGVELVCVMLTKHKLLILY